MRARTLTLALAASAALFAAAPALAQSDAPSGTAACSAGPISDGVYETTERQKKNKGNDAAKAGKSGKAAAPSPEGKEVTEITLTWQCGGTGPGGAFIPEGYKMEVRGECPAGTCDLGTTVAMPGKGDGEYVAVLADDEVGFRQMQLQAKRKAVNLTVRTEVEGQRRPAQARYTLEHKAN